MTAYRAPSDTPERELARSIAEGLAGFGFKPKDIGASIGPANIVGAWVRKTWNTNRAAVHLRAPEAGDLGELSQAVKMQLGKELGYVTFFYGMGLQLVWSGDAILDRASRIERAVDPIDNQRCIVQSIFVVDLEKAKCAQARTWGQVITGKFQDQIERSIKSVIEPASSAASR
jgi:hypothetical protein